MCSCHGLYIKLVGHSDCRPVPRDRKPRTPMASLRLNNQRRRSHSTPNTSPIARHSPNHPYTMRIDEIQGQEQCDAPHSTVSRRFPSSSADFNLYPKSRRRADYSSSRLNYKDLAHLRSKAFWELHRSIAENGEGFVRRMRDYERVRSRRISDPNYRGRRHVCSSNTTRNSSYMSDSDVSEDDDDDIQIFAGDLSNDTSQPRHPGSWVTSLDSPSPHLWSAEDVLNRPGYISPILPSPSPLAPHRAGQARSVPTSSNTVAPPSPFSSSSTISSTLPHTPFRHLEDDNCPVFPLSSSLLPSPSSGQTHLISPEKIVSDLSLALATGAGSINDYSCIENPPTFQQADEGNSGELWH